MGEGQTAEQTNALFLLISALCWSLVSVVNMSQLSSGVRSHGQHSPMVEKYFYWSHISRQIGPTQLWPLSWWRRGSDLINFDLKDVQLCSVLLYWQTTYYRHLSHPSLVWYSDPLLSDPIICLNKQIDYLQQHGPRADDFNEHLAHVVKINIVGLHNWTKSLEITTCQ